ncbi:MAG TPA: DDE-type integrase/transposase/recombinase [Chitinophagaceae bacterium]|nr:DDE-type integrase/transposase/recombinase [Chitinophagaceae bacterium]
MNKLPLQKRMQIINMLVEGSSMRSTSRVCDVSINTVTKLLVDVGIACQLFHNKMVVDVASKRVQCDEIWSFVYAKEKNAPENMDNVGDVWTWTAIDADSKLIIDFFVGQRDAESANTFMNNVAIRLKNKVQLTTDGLKAYLEAVYDSFGSRIDFAQLVKLYGGNNDNQGTTEKKYSPAECTGAKKTVIIGNPDENHISTSYVERQNLTIRMSNRRFTRLTNAFSKKIDNHCHALALHFVYYNFVRQHKTLRVTPAMAAGLSKRFLSIEDIVKLAD